MMRWTSDGGKPFVESELTGRYGVYLDNDSLIDLAKGAPDRRQRFVNQIRAKGGLLFSLTNAAELAGPQGASAAAVRNFLDSLGAYWVPLELNPYKVMEKEAAGVSPAKAPVSDAFMLAYAQRRSYDLSPGGSSILDLSESFFRLSALLDWAQEERDQIRADAERMDDTLKAKIIDLRAAFEADPASLDRLIPPILYDPQRPATFALAHLLRTLVREAKAYHLKKGDALDLCHAVPAAAYASVGTLDKQWKRRVDDLPRPNGLAKIFYRPELDDLIALLESLPTP